MTLNAGQQAEAARDFSPPRRDTVLGEIGLTLPKLRGSRAGLWGPEQDPLATELTLLFLRP